MNTASPSKIHRLDYTPPPYLVDRIELDVDFLAGEVRVRSELQVRRAPATPPGTPFRLDGEELETLAIHLDGQPLVGERQLLTAQSLTIVDPPAAFRLSSTVRLHPDDNTSLSGLYVSRDGYFTQCEAQGFRRITWFPDRPDIMARYTVTLHADRHRLPVLLANGNPVTQGEEDGGRHWARWDDPFPKPCYLFALVAARLDALREPYLTADGRRVELALFVEPGKLDQCAHAMDALKRAMRWDEAVYGLSCDLDHYMIVAVGDFNMGAMENKGLNIFNTKYVLARADTATDSDYQNIDRVVAHEYFHNWTGNRVTCRDWFQLSLKEGLTVFRDQQFGADMHGRAVTRIRDVRTLRAAQFPEDAGPMAHPVRPDAYLEIDNFYTSTVYEKGAEVVRMIRTLIGKAAFRRGMDLYFSRHDGQAVTCDDFVAAMADASGVDLRQFMRWYDHAGTPRLRVEGYYDPAARRYQLTIRQQQPAGDAPPLHIPLAIGLLGGDGVDLPLRLAGDAPDEKAPTHRILSLTENEQNYFFENIEAPPVPSLLRDFSAPVIVDYDWRNEELEHLLAHDSDDFNRWDAGQRLASRLILDAAGQWSSGAPLVWPARFAETFRQVLTDGSRDPAFVAEVLTLPGEATLAEEMAVVDPDALHAARHGLRRFLAEQLEDQWRQCYQALSGQTAYRPTPADAGRRALRNVCLAYLGETDTPANRALIWEQFATADNMTDQFAALAVLAQLDCPERTQALADFHARWHAQALVVDKWLAVQAASRLPSTLSTVNGLLHHPSFDLRNPNKVYALLGSFGNNHLRFHAADGSGYRFLGERIAELDPLNPQVAARLARRFDRWRRFDSSRQSKARDALTSLRDSGRLSSDVGEIIERSLAE
ncbi:MAG TPA: aminopeptidase N [Accumulibacter sp.]|nr:aminopeptidase N [Accumulibacter sp.]HMW16646.1 aminopeptidase N [Accumulibacter sp.]HMX22996.1 aminopeptidase N [Accumulibacter sp.]HMY07397.1 aminopeptidase N [Accumulibacter sp.]HNC16715.1 aminopeptidase N [Accumulibacter sp.]